MLLMQLKSDLDPKITGFAGHYHTGDIHDVIDSFNENSSSVRHILNLIVARSNGASWISRAGPKQLSDVPPFGLWQIFEYSQSPEWYSDGLHEIAAHLPENPDVEQ